MAVFQKNDPTLTDFETWHLIRAWVDEKVAEFNLPYATEYADSYVVFGSMPTVHYDRPEEVPVSICMSLWPYDRVDLSITVGECNRHTISVQYDILGQMRDAKSSGHPGNTSQNAFALARLGLPKLAS